MIALTLPVRTCQEPPSLKRRSSDASRRRHPASSREMPSASARWSTELAGTAVPFPKSTKLGPAHPKNEHATIQKKVNLHMNTSMRAIAVHQDYTNRSRLVERAVKRYGAAIAVPTRSPLAAGRGGAAGAAMSKNAAAGVEPL